MRVLLFLSIYPRCLGSLNETHRERARVWVYFRDSGSPILVEDFLAVFSDSPVLASTCTRVIVVSEQIQWRTKTGDLTGPSEDDWVPGGALKEEAGRIIAGHLGSSLFPDPAQKPDSLLTDNDQILDPFASFVLTVVFGTQWVLSKCFFE